jgi:hypothetical protein
MWDVTTISRRTFQNATKNGEIPQKTLLRWAADLGFKRHSDLLRVLNGEKLQTAPATPIPKTLSLACPKMENPQGADYRIYPLQAARPWVLRCSIATESPYFRFGIKLLGEEGRVFGDGVIPSRDDNLVIHIGRNDYDRPRIGATARDIFFTAYDRGIATEANDSFLFASEDRVKVSLELAVDKGGDFASLVVNGLSVIRRQVSPAICSCVVIYAWGDREACQVEVAELVVESI